MLSESHGLGQLLQSYCTRMCWDIKFNKDEEDGENDHYDNDGVEDEVDDDDDDH